MSGYVVCVFNVVALLNDIKCDFYNYIQGIYFLKL
jgi:hypothetical protein